MEKVVKPIHSGKERVWVLFQLPQALHRAVRVAAAEEQLTFRSMCQVALREYVTRRGLLPAEERADRPEGPA